jgi:large subunit ribosomal protein L29
MKVKELRKKNPKELKKIEANLREKLRALRFDLGAGKVKNVKEMKAIKKEIAQILTILKENAQKTA